MSKAQTTQCCPDIKPLFSQMPGGSLFVFFFSRFHFHQALQMKGREVIWTRSFTMSV